MKYPTNLLRDIYWAFREPIFPDLKDFINELKTYNKVVLYRKININFEAKIFDYPEIVIQYLIYDEQDEYTEPQVKLVADNKSYFTVGELLHKLHNEVGYFLFDEDNCFFEGLTYATDDDPDFPNTPVYFLDTGS